MDYLFSIEDPFDIKHNPGDRPNNENLKYLESIKQEFKKAAENLKYGKFFDVFWIWFVYFMNVLYDFNINL